MESYGCGQTVLPLLCRFTRDFIDFIMIFMIFTMRRKKNLIGFIFLGFLFNFSVLGLFHFKEKILYNSLVAAKKCKVY